MPLASFKETVTVPGPAGFTIAYTFTELRMNDCKASNTSPDSLFPLLEVDVVDWRPTLVSIRFADSDAT
ncbi:hypothetical protein D3C80_1891490 [compost metagenome]